MLKLAINLFILAQEWPWQIRITLDEEFRCGGTIISDKIIVTAAHCLESTLGSFHYQLIAGDVDRLSYETTEQISQVCHLSIC